MITSRSFGKTKDGREVLAFTFEDGARRATVLNLGGIIQSIVVPDKNGNPTDVILGYNDVAGYEEHGGYLGALIGRFGNRIEKGKLVIDGETYDLYCNDRGNHLHGGKVGFDKKIWAHEIKGDELVNLTNHAYFNIDGEGSGSALENVLWIDCDYITPTNSTMIPTGGFRAVKGTAFDFNTPKEIGKDVGADDIDLKQGNGYDHCHVLKNKCGEYVKYATVTGKKSGITMSCYTDMPAVQFYAGNGLNQQGKTAYYGRRAGFCLETQAIPNNVNVPEYAEKGSSILDAGEVYEFSAAYKFQA